ncbi:D-alanyl-D-alanine carboxypeptidase family protein [Paenibacillus zeisoli]|uniref:D-alanyl-D-alanine carboxypeptidase family protein n=1 Tax=Paenibacillus zeisoli TaxID=2496267 RepID=A0A3S1B9J8_9BACL|nr:M15 family metallopeptidase [Paenibacillus zeisoli]RUT33359.1 D-alanyl-D-alanine carboxypeptidase family protein [Paenibacillus zeisoli]
MKNQREEIQSHTAESGKSSRMVRLSMTAVALLLTAALSAGCAKDNAPSSTKTPESSSAQQTPGTETGQGKVTEPASAPSESSGTQTGNTTEGTGEKGTVKSEGHSEGLKETATDPESDAVLVNKQFGLPDDYEPKDLVYPNVPFTFSEKIDKRKMRKEAAAALEEMFAGAEKDGISLAGVSAYRSKKTQTSLFNRYVKKDGLEKAKTYSAVPGYSEHQTGLAIDVSGSDGKCAAESCFGGTKEAEWLKEHAQEYGFIIRYPEGKESITGYKYEPWHIRYVGKDIAQDVTSKGITLEEYYNAVKVSGTP